MYVCLVAKRHHLDEFPQSNVITYSTIATSLYVFNRYIMQYIASFTTHAVTY